MSVSPSSYNQSYIYIIKGSDRIKIGYSIDPKGRLNALTSNTHDDLTMLYLTDLVSNYRKIEKVVHKLLKPFKTKGEWFHGVSDNEAIDTINKAIAIVNANQTEEVLNSSKKYKYDKVNISLTGPDKELLIKIKEVLGIKHNVELSLSQVVSHLIKSSPLLDNQS